MRSAADRPAGRVTRGTTNPNRLRRVDRWLVARHQALLRRAADPLVVDLGFGRHPVTVWELAARVRRVRPDAEVVGVEIDRERVTEARRRSGTGWTGREPAVPDPPPVRFEYGGFDLACLGGRSPLVIRAFNVLRQYDVTEVGAAWDLMRSRLAPGGILLDGTCDEVGRLASWVVVDAGGPRSLVVALRLAGLPAPSAVAARLPKVLIARNTPPFAVHRFLSELDEQWQRAASGTGAWGARQRFEAACQALAGLGWPLQGPTLWRDGTVEVAWHAVSD